MTEHRLRRKPKSLLQWWLPRLGWPVAGAVAILHWQSQEPARAPRPAVPTHPVTGPSVPLPSPMSPVMTPSRPEPAATNAPPFQRAWHWRELESSDYAAYIQKLRDVGCPDQTIVDLVLMDVGRVYQARREQLQRGKPRPGQEPDDTWQALAQERNQLVRQLVGVDFTTELQALTEEFTPGTRVPTLDFLPLEKQVVARRLFAVAQAQEDRVVQSSDGVLEEAQSEQLREIRAQAERQLQRLLSPEEFAVYRAQATAQ